MRRRFKSQQPITRDDSDDNNRNGKRVRFSGKGLTNSADVPRSDVPKTSEYAYFKNVKNRNVHSSDRSEAQHCRLNTGSDNAPDVRKFKNKDFEHSVSEERMRTSDQHTLVSPRVNLTFNTEQRSPLLSQHITPKGQQLPPILPNDSTCYTKQKSSVISQNLTPARGRQHFPSSTHNEDVDISGNQCSKKGIFSEKRQRLLQWVVQTSSLNILNTHPNGLDRSDLVAGLLNRLFPKCNESHGSSTDRSDNSKSLLVHNSKDLEKEPKVPHARNQAEHLPIIRYGNSNEIVPSEWNIFESSSSSHKFGYGNLIEYDTMDFDRVNNSKSSSQKQLQFYHLKELDELCLPVEYARKEPCNRFLLDWNPERQKTGVYSSIVNRNSANLATSWHDDYQKMVDHVFDTKELCLPLAFSSLLNYESPNDRIQDFEPALERVKYSVAEPDQFAQYSVAEPDQFALTFPNTGGVSVEDYRSAENALFSIDDMTACNDNHRFENKACDGKLKDLWQKFLYASDISEEDTPSSHAWQFPCARQYPFSGNSFDHYLPSSNYHDRYLDSLTNQTSLRSNFRKDQFEIDLYPDDDHNLEFGQVL